MNGYLRQSTASQVRTIGAFLDDTDFKTLENALTINNTDIVISINGAADTVKNSGGATAHGAGGLYTLTWDATDTASVGELAFSVKVAGALVVFGTYVVLEEAVYDRDFAASATGIVGTAQTGDNFARLGAPAGASVSADIAAIEAQTDDIGAAGAGLTAVPWNAAWDAEVQSEVNDGLVAYNAARTTNITAGTIATVSGNVNGSVASVTAAVAITSNIKQNQALANFEFLMTDSTNHAPSTGLTVTVTRSIDGGAFAAGTLSAVTELSNGIYKVDFGAGDLNGKVITLRATAAASDDCFERIVTQV